MAASAADHALLSALYQLFLREILSTLSMKAHASTAVLALLSALYQLSLRVESKRKKIKGRFSKFTWQTVLFCFYIWRSQMNEETRSVFECAWFNPAQALGSTQLRRLAQPGSGAWHNPAQALGSPRLRRLAHPAQALGSPYLVFSLFANLVY